MSLSQKFSGFSIVPWYNSDEWKRVYQLIFGENATLEKQREALTILNLWKTRMNLLPSGIEGTIYILESLLIDSNVLSEQQCCIQYSSNIMRFLNICVATRSQVYNFTKTAKSYSIPDWIINIRHDFAHSPKVPSFSLLKLALDECFKWLKETYWDPELLVIKDYVIEKKVNDEGVAVVKLVADLIVWLNSEKPLPDVLHEQVSGFEFGYVDVENFPDVMNELFKNVSDGYDDYEKWRDLIGELIYSGCFYIHPKSKNEDIKEMYTFKYMSKLIELMHVNKNLINLINELQKIMNDESVLEANRLSVSRWLNAIFIGMLKLKRTGIRGDIEELSGKGIRFKVMPKNIYKELVGLRDRMFVNINEVNRKCFNSCMLLCNAKDIKACNEYFNQLKNAGGKTGWQNLEDSNDFIDLSKNTDWVLSESLNETVGNESSNEIKLNLKEGCKKRWTLVTDVSFENCPIGVHSFNFQTQMEIC